MFKKRTIQTLFLGAILGILALSLPIKAKAQNTLCGYVQLFEPNPASVTFTPYGTTQTYPTGFDINAFGPLPAWVELTGIHTNRSGVFMSVDSFRVVESCAPATAIAPILDFYVDNTTINAGECTTLHWNTNSVYQQVFLESTNGPVVSGDGHAPASGSAIVCPLMDSTYRLTGAYGTTQDFKDITINVIQPTSTPIPPTATRIPTKTPIPSTSTSIPPSATIIPPTTKPTIPLPTATTYHDGPLLNDGYNPGPSAPSWLDGIIQFFVPPVEASYSPDDCQKRFAGPNNEYAGQCTTFVSRKRPDACEWITPGSGNAYQWVEQAQLNGGPFGLTISSNPHIGDIVVWQPSKEQECGGTSPIPENGPCTIGKSGGWEGCGHVAYVTWVSTDGKTMKIEEDNWGIDRTKDVINVLSCMKFISNPSKITLSPTAIATSIPIPVPGVAPTPSGQPSNPFQWIIDLFKP